MDALTKLEVAMLTAREVRVTFRAFRSLSGPIHDSIVFGEIDRASRLLAAAKELVAQAEAEQESERPIPRCVTCGYAEASIVHNPAMGEYFKHEFAPPTSPAERPVGATGTGKATLAWLRENVPAAFLEVVAYCVNGWEPPSDERNLYLWDGDFGDIWRAAQAATTPPAAASESGGAIRVRK